MQIIFKYIFTNVKEQRGRTMIMLLSILLSSTLLFVSFSIGASYEQAQQKMARGMAGSAVLSVQATEHPIKSQEVPDLPSICAKSEIWKGTALYHENGYYETVDLIAADGMSFNPPRLLDGREIEHLLAGQIVLPDRFTSKYGIEKGDLFALEIGGVPVTFEVAEIAAYDTLFLRHTRGTTALVSLSNLGNSLLESDGHREILLEPSENVSVDTMLKELASVLPLDHYLITKLLNEDSIKADAREKSMPFFLISFFSTTMSIFIIYSSYKVITLDRLPILGTFRSIGAEERDVTKLLLLESLLYGCVGGLISFPIGIIVLKILLQGMGTSFVQGIEITPVISPLGMAFSLVLAIVVSLLSAWIPVRRVSRLSIKEIVFGTVEEKHISRQFIMVTGIILFLVSATLPHIVPEPLLYLAGGCSLLGMIAATILIIQMVTNLLSAGMEYVYEKFLGNEGWLAARNMRNNKNIAQNITLLFISISAMIAIQVVGDFVTTYVSDVFRGAELQGFADGIMDEDFVEQVKNMDGIEKVLPIHVFENKIYGNGFLFSRIETTEHIEWYSSMLALHYTDASQTDMIFSNFEAKRTIILSENCVKQAGFSIGDTILLSDGNAEYPYHIAGSFQSRATDVDAVIASGYGVTDFGAKDYDFLAYTATDPDAIIVQIRNLFGSTPNWSRTTEEFYTDAISTVGAFLAPMHSMTWFILLLAAAGVINNLMVNYIQKRRAIAMYKSIGLSNKQHIKIMLIEGFSSGLIGAVIAILVSYMEIQTIFLVAGPKISMVPELKAQTFFTAGALGVLITLLGSMVPIFKSRRMKLIEEIRFES